MRTVPMPAARFALATLATWRVTHLLVAEDGPADVVVRLRRRAGSSWAGDLLERAARRASAPHHHTHSDQEVSPP